MSSETTPLLKPSLRSDEGGSMRGLSSRRTSECGSVRGGIGGPLLVRAPVTERILSTAAVARYNVNLALTAFAVVLAPYRIAFLSERNTFSSPVWWIVVLLDCWFLFDWLLTLHYEYESHKKEDEHAPIMLRLSHIFTASVVYRFVASLPYGSLICPVLCGVARSDGPMFLEVLRLLRLTDIHEAFFLLERSLFVSYYTARFARFFCIVLFHAHWSGCVWWFLARIDGLTDHTWVGRFSPDLVGNDHTAQYLRSLYFSFVVYASIGFGDIAAVSKSEEAFLVCVIMINLALGAYIVGNMAALATSADAGVAKFRGKMRRWTEYMRARRFPPDLAQRIVDFQRLAFETHDPYHEILDDEDLPYAYRLEVAEHLNRPLLEAGTLFKGCADAVLAAVAVSLRPLTYAPGSLGQVESGARQLFVVGYGQVELVSEIEGQTATRVAGVGDAFGVAGFFFQTTIPLEARALTTCTIYTLDYEDFAPVAETHPQSVLVARKAAMQQLRDFYGDLFPAVAAELRRVRQVNSQDLILAAYTNDTARAEELIAEGADVNAADYDDRTALHVAASEGHVAMTDFLLAHGADPRSVDRWGATPAQNAAGFKNGPLAEKLQRAEREARARLGDDSIPHSIPEGDEEAETATTKPEPKPSRRTPTPVAAGEKEKGSKGNPSPVPTEGPWQMHAPAARGSPLADLVTQFGTKAEPGAVAAGRSPREAAGRSPREAAGTPTRGRKGIPPRSSTFTASGQISPHAAAAAAVAAAEAAAGVPKPPAEPAAERGREVRHSHSSEHLVMGAQRQHGSRAASLDIPRPALPHSGSGGPAGASHRHSRRGSVVLPPGAAVDIPMGPRFGAAPAAALAVPAVALSSSYSDAFASALRHRAARRRPMDEPMHAPRHVPSTPFVQSNTSPPPAGMRGRRQSFSIEHASSGEAARGHEARRRVTVVPEHEARAGHMRAGRLMYVEPGTDLATFLAMAGARLQMTARAALTQRGAVIDDLALLAQDDVVVVTDQVEGLPAPSSSPALAPPPAAAEPERPLHRINST